MNAIASGMFGGKYDSTVTPFRKSGIRSTTASEIDPRSMFEGHDAVERAAAMIQALVTQQVLEAQMRAHASPFDAVYFSALVPDQIPRSALEGLQRFRNVIDLSDELGFDDGLD